MGEFKPCLPPLVLGLRWVVSQECIAEVRLQGSVTQVGNQKQNGDERRSDKEGFRLIELAVIGHDLASREFVVGLNIENGSAL